MLLKSRDVVIGVCCRGNEGLRFLVEGERLLE